MWTGRPPRRGGAPAPAATEQPPRMLRAPGRLPTPNTPSAPCRRVLRRGSPAGASIGEPQPGCARRRTGRCPTEREHRGAPRCSRTIWTTRRPARARSCPLATRTRPYHSGSVDVALGGSSAPPDQPFSPNHRPGYRPASRHIGRPAIAAVPRQWPQRFATLVHLRRDIAATMRGPQLPASMLSCRSRSPVVVDARCCASSITRPRRRWRHPPHPGVTMLVDAPVAAKDHSMAVPSVSGYRV